MSGHTPGPWNFRRSELLNGYVIETDDRRVAITPYDGRVATQPTGEADAHLIAAAPELLAALRDAVEFISGHNECLEPSTHSGDKEWNDYCVALHKSCQEAINKAEGGGK